MKIQIIQKQCGGTEFLAQPHRLHLGAQNAAGVDELLFQLPVRRRSTVTRCWVSSATGASRVPSLRRRYSARVHPARQL